MASRSEKYINLKAIAPFTKEGRSIDNGKYKSRGERQIAGFLESRGIDFQYEYPLAIRDRGQVRIWYPDFRLPQYGMIVEYFGIDGNAAYDEQMAHKITAYKQAGIEGIYLVESSFFGDWQGSILDRIEQSLAGKLRRISACKSGEYSARAKA